jgi:hypothetical protein
MNANVNIVFVFNLIESKKYNNQKTFLRKFFSQHYDLFLHKLGAEIVGKGQKSYQFEMKRISAEPIKHFGKQSICLRKIMIVETKNKVSLPLFSSLF